MAKPSIYPPYCFNAAPTYNVSSFLKVTDISCLQLYRNIPGVHFYRNLPVRWVRIVGVIVGIEDFPGKRVYAIDDSSGLNLQCVLSLEARPDNINKVLASGPLIPPEYSEFDVGHVVDLRGPIVPYRRQKAIKIRRMKPVPTTQHELLLWERRLKFRAEVLDVPWVLSDEEIREHRRKAERADAKDLNLLAGKRKRRARQDGVKGARGQDDDPFKIRKRAAKPSNARSRVPPNCTNTTTHEMPTTASRSEADPRSFGTKPDPYSIKASMAMEPALASAPRAPINRRFSVQDDPFRITKKGSRQAVKPPIQHSTRPSVESVPEKELPFVDSNQLDSVLKTEMPSESQVQVSSEKHDLAGRSKSPKLRQMEPSVPAPTPKTQKTTLAGSVDDPYVIKARCRRTLPRPTVCERNTPADPFKITRSRGGPCSEKNPNVELERSNKGSHVTPTSRVSRPPQRHAGSGKRFDTDDPFKITKRARR